VVADVAELSVGREEYYTRELATEADDYAPDNGAFIGESDPGAGDRRAPALDHGRRPSCWPLQ
jgi:hypothetical protein